MIALRTTGLFRRAAKNNDGEPGARSAWERRNGLFAPVTDFDWDTFDRPKDEEVTIMADDLAAIFENGEKQRTKPKAVKALRTLTGTRRTASSSRNLRAAVMANVVLSSARVRGTVREQMAARNCKTSGIDFE